MCVYVCVFKYASGSRFDGKSSMNKYRKNKRRNHIGIKIALRQGSEYSRLMFADPVSSHVLIKFTHASELIYASGSKWKPHFVCLILSSRA